MIRKATHEDVSRIAEIMVFGKRVAYRPIFKNDCFSFNELQVIHVIEKLRCNPASIEHMAVYDDGILKGVINGVITNDEMEICDFYVEPFFKGQGIGSKLLQHVIAEAKAANVKRVFLWVLKENLSARKFYEANGFKDSKVTCLVKGTNKIEMCYELSSSNIFS